VVAGESAGVVTDPGACGKMQPAFVVYLRAPVAVLAQRVGTGDDRPWLGDDPRAALERLYEDREPLYLEVADLVLDVEGLRAAALTDRILGTLGLVDP
jgi:shikimate kinase